MRRIPVQFMSHNVLEKGNSSHAQYIRNSVISCMLNIYLSYIHTYNICGINMEKEKSNADENETFNYN